MEKMKKEGLSSYEARIKFGKYGPNIGMRRNSVLGLISEQFMSLSSLILIAVSLFLYGTSIIGDLKIIVFLVFFYEILVILQKRNFKRTFLEIARKASSSVTVLRDGLSSEISVLEIVPGDIIILDEGLVVPADIQLLDREKLEFDDTRILLNSFGELVEEPINANHGSDFIKAGTVIKKGTGKGLVIATGFNTELEQSIGKKPCDDYGTHLLTKRIRSFRKKYLFAALSLSFSIILFSYLSGQHASDAFFIILSVLASVPAIPLIFNSWTGFGSLEKPSWYLKLLAGTEKLGSISHLMLERKGVFSKNTINIDEVYVGGKTIIRPSSRGREMYDGDVLSNPFFMLMTACALTNEAIRDDNGLIAGDLRDATLYNFARNSGFYKETLIETFPRVAGYISDDRRCMTTLHRAPFQSRGCEYISFSVGDFDVLSDKAEYSLSIGGLRKNDLSDFIKMNQKMAKMGQEVIVVTMQCWPSLPADFLPGTDESDLTLIGLVGMMDPVSEGTKDVVSFCQNMGITLVMTTNEHIETAKAVVKKMGINDATDSLLTDKDMNELPDQKLSERVEQLRVCSRFNTEQKLRILKALQSRRLTVSIIGSVLEDMPLLRQAEVKLPIRSSQSRHGAAHLLNIVESIKESRICNDNLNRFARFIMTLGISELFTIMLLELFGIPLRLLPVHFLWLNLVVGGCLALALSMPEGKVLKNDIPMIDQFAFSKVFKYQMFFACLLIGVLILAQTLFKDIADENWPTQLFLSFGFMYIFFAASLVSEKEISWRLAPSKMNRLGIIFVVFSVHAAVPYVPFLRQALEARALSGYELAACIVMPFALFAILKLENTAAKVLRIVSPERLRVANH